MGFLGDFIDDALDLPGKLIGGISGMTADVVAETLSLPVKLVQAAIDAGCKTEQEVKRFVERNM